jgi:hypothetical protein
MRDVAWGLMRRLELSPHELGEGLKLLGEVIEEHQGEGDQK